MQEITRTNSRPWKTMMELSPITMATLQASALSLISNIIAQLIDAHQTNRPVGVDVVELIRFVAFTVVATPPYYVWQEYLERKFPGQYEDEGGSGDVELTEDDEDEKDDENGDHVHLMTKMRPLTVTVSVPGDEEEGFQGGLLRMTSSRRRQFIHVRNTLAKWFIDCFTVGTILHTVAFLVFMSALKGETPFQIGRNVRKETIPIMLNDYKVWPVADIISFTFIPVERRVVFLSFVEALWDIYVSLVAAKL